MAKSGDKLIHYLNMKNLCKIDDTFVNAVIKEAEMVASECDELQLKLHDLTQKGILIYREIELMNLMLKYNGEKAVDVPERS